MNDTDMVVLLERIHLYNAGRPCGAVALRRHLLARQVHPMPSVSKIATILREYGLTHGRLGWDEDVEPCRLYEFTKEPKGGATS